MKNWTNPKRLGNPAASDGPVLSVQFVLLPHFTLLPFAAFIDALRLAGDEGDRSRQINCQWTIAAASREPVESSCGVKVTPWEQFGDPRRYDYLVVCGGLLHRGPQTDHATLDYLRAAADAGVKLVGLCTGSFALVRAGLMKGRRCCVSWYHYQDLLREFPGVQAVADQLYVIDGNRITCAGGRGAIDVAAWIIERHCGHAWAQKSLRIMLVDGARPQTTPQPHPPMAESARDDRVRRAQLLIEQNLGEPLSVAELASRVSLSKRQLERLFKQELGIGPLEYDRRFRLGYGHWLLRNTARTVNQIALDCGFTDSSHFTRACKQTFGCTPGQIRDRDSGSNTELPRITPNSTAENVAGAI
ncbi:MAG: GlxA family transcriptional regulator [Gammaproteobacteria bacterium]